jgi:hypothetical protein
MFCDVAPEATEAYDNRRGALPPNALGRLLLPAPVPSVMLIEEEIARKGRGIRGRVTIELVDLVDFGALSG